MAGILCATGLATLAVGQSYTVSTVAGIDWIHEGRLALAAPLRSLTAVAQDAEGNIYAGLRTDHRVVRFGTDRRLTVVAGNGSQGAGGDGGPATLASLDWPSGLRLDGRGNLYIADRGTSLVRRVNLSTGIITTIAGTPYRTAFAGDGGPATRAGMDPWDIALDGAGNLFIADFLNHRVRRVSASDGNISTYAGNGLSAGFGGDGGPAKDAALPCPISIAAHPQGTVYLFHGCGGDGFIRRVDASTSVISTFAGLGFTASPLTQGPAVRTPLAGNTQLTIAANGDVWMMSGNFLGYVSISDGILRPIAGDFQSGFAGDGGPLSSVRFFRPTYIAAAPSGDLIIADSGNKRIRRFRNGAIDTVAGGEPGVVFLNRPRDLLWTSPNVLYVADSGNDLVRKISGDSIGNLFAYTFPTALAMNKDGVLYVASESRNPRASELATALDRLSFPSSYAEIVQYDSRVTPFAGRFGGYFTPGDGGDAMNARFYSPQGLAADQRGNVYIGDLFYVRWVDTTNIVQRLAGNSVFTAPGENVVATQAGIVPQGMTMDRDGNLLVADQNNHVIRRVNLSTNLISTVAGTFGQAGFSGDGGPPTAARLNIPTDVAVDAAGNIHIADYGNSRLRVVRGNVITTIAGNGRSTFEVESGPALQVPIAPFAVTAAADGSVFFSDFLNDRIRKLTPGTASNCTLFSPFIQSVRSAGDYGGNAGFSSGSWLEIKGANLAATERTWAESDFQGPVAPSLLDGTTVSINGKRAFVFYISPTQLNVQAPNDADNGVLPVTVSNCAGTSNTVFLQKNVRTPGMLASPAFRVGGKQYLVALFPDLTYAGEPGLIAGASFRPAKPGDIITAYGIGFGEVTPPVAAGTAVSQPNAIPNLTIRFGTTPAATTYAGLAQSYVGLYQFNIVVPAVPDGDHLIEIDAGGVKVPQALYLTVRAAPLSAWNFDNTPEGWTPANVTSSTVADGIWTLDPSGGAPFVIGPNILLSAGEYKFVHVRMNSKCTGIGSIFFRTAGNNSFSADRRVTFDPSPARDNFATITIPMSQHPQWTPTAAITGIRLDPCLGGIAGSDADLVQIDSIRISPTP